MATESLNSAKTSVVEAPIDQALREISLMHRYVLAEGLRPDAETQSLVAAAEGRPEPSRDLTVILKAHAALSALVAPATPASLQATEPGSGLLSFLPRPPLVGALIVVALAAAIGFILTLPHPPQRSEPRPAAAAGGPFALRPAADTTVFTLRVADAAPEVVSDAAAPWQSQWNWLFAAALGASFYGLSTAHEFVKNRTFDPKYNSMYVIRFIWGVIAGLVLGNVAGVFDSSSTIKRLGPSVLAILGGFSAEAVIQVLQRMVDIMLATLRGDNTAAVKAKAATEVATEKQAVREDLLAITRDPNINPQARDAIHNAMKRLT
jgi:hypothetical protein